MQALVVRCEYAPASNLASTIALNLVVFQAQDQFVQQVTDPLLQRRFRDWQFVRFRRWSYHHLMYSLLVELRAVHGRVSLQVVEAVQVVSLPNELVR